MNLIYILYDSIGNSVFGSQVWSPLIKHAQQNPKLTIRLISFETKKVFHKFRHPQIEIIQIKKYKYFGKLNLQFNVGQIKKHLPSKKFKIIARGPFAGWIAKKLDSTKTTIQVRGLAAAEYSYTQQTKSLAKKILVTLKTKLLYNLEKSAYSTNNPNITFECVSPALQNYLIKTYGTPAKQITIAQSDIPIKFTPAQYTKWQNNIRKKLNIVKDAVVYCYSGSTHKWQCPDKIVNFFKEKLKNNNKSFLMILTSSPKVFETLIKKTNIPVKNHIVLSVHHNEIYEYLSAADFGLLFREEHILNWVSRPTKALEYQSVGLKIIHNNTVKWLIDNS